MWQWASVRCRDPEVLAEAVAAGPIAGVRDGDEITFDIERRTLAVDVDDQELSRRAAEWTPIDRGIKPGVMAKYAKLVSSAATGATTS